MKVFCSIILILVFKCLTLQGAFAVYPLHLLEDKHQHPCCCAVEPNSVPNKCEDCSPAEDASCHSQDSESSCSEQCSQRCNCVFYKVSLFCDQQALNLEIKGNIPQEWLADKESSLVYSPEPPPPKV